MNRLMIIAGAVVLALTQLAPAAPQAADDRVVLVTHPEMIMDTDVELTVIVKEADRQKGDTALAAAEQALRDVETLMSAHIADTELYKFNEAPANQEVPLSAETLKVLRAARDYARQTDGVFDITCRPLLQLWKRAGKAKRLPTDAEMKEALSLVGWDKIKLTDKGAMKLKDGVTFDLGGIAKKWGIDRAAEAIIKEKAVLGGIVNVGGDLRCFGHPKLGKNWQVGVKDPFDKDGEIVATMSIPDGAVCTSGNYERFVTIDGKRYSHIVDPRTGRTADSLPSVTVYGKTAVESGIWATALSVTGNDGVNLMPKNAGLEVLTISGTSTSFKFFMTPGFKKLLREMPIEPLPPLTQPATATAPDK